ncbi:sugar kinase [Niallia taxi]|nr:MULTISPECIES: sugar kinase [Bacillaceae]MCE4049973.1 sugar kinase [Bacillus sp. Au-Bac7]MCM3032760.1 sugar kinase [Niallia sp. MER 6]
MMSRIVTVGEPMALFAAEHEGLLEEAEKFSRFVAGAEVNFSIGMARLGHQVTYITKLGNDPFGKNIQTFLEKNNIDTSFVSYDDKHVTGMQWKQKVVKGDPEVFSLRKNSAASNMDIQSISSLQFEDFDHLHLTGIPPALSPSCRELVYELAQNAKRSGVPISFDPNIRPALWPDKQEMVKVINNVAVLADIVFPGMEEGRILTGRETPEGIAQFYHDAGVKTVVIKLGPQGAFTSSLDKSFYTKGFKVSKVIDTVGAGDGFAVGVTSALLENLPLEEAIIRGTAIGALAVMSPGDNDGLPDRENLNAFMELKLNR